MAANCCLAPVKSHLHNSYMVPFGCCTTSQSGDTDTSTANRRAALSLRGCALGRCMDNAICRVGSCLLSRVGSRRWCTRCILWLDAVAAATAAALLLLSTFPRMKVSFWRPPHEKGVGAMALSLS